MRIPASGNICEISWSATGDMIFCARVQPTVPCIHPLLTDEEGQWVERQLSAQQTSLSGKQPAVTLTF